MSDGEVIQDYRIVRIYRILLSKNNPVNLVNPVILSKIAWYQSNV